MEHIQMIMMDPHIKDLNHMYHYGIFNGLCGVASPYLPRAPIKRHKSSGKRLSLSGISVGEIAPRFLKVKLISGRQLHHNSNTSLFVQVKCLRELMFSRWYLRSLLGSRTTSVTWWKATHSARFSWRTWCSNWAVGFRIVLLSSSFTTVVSIGCWCGTLSRWRMYDRGTGISS
jgi:hypothetical protein